MLADYSKAIAEIGMDEKLMKEQYSINDRNKVLALDRCNDLALKR